MEKYFCNDSITVLSWLIGEKKLLIFAGNWTQKIRKLNDISFWKHTPNENHKALYIDTIYCTIYYVWSTNKLSNELHTAVSIAFSVPSSMQRRRYSECYRNRSMLFVWMFIDVPNVDFSPISIEWFNFKGNFFISYSKGGDGQSYIYSHPL